MKVMIVSYFFPPYNCMGAVRTGKLAKFLVSRGHDVSVLSARDQPLPTTLTVEVDEAIIERTPWLNVNRPAEIFLGGRARVRQEGYTTQGKMAPVVRRFGDIYKTLFHIPDGEIGWYPHAVRAGARMLRTTKPDLIYASAAPYTSLLVGARLGRDFGIPWIGELRDLWAGNHYFSRGAVSQRLTGRMERRVLSGASALVTVSAPWAETLAQKYDLPVEVVMNGYDPDDFPPPTANRPEGRHIRIVYTGIVMAGKRDPSLLFRALRLMGETGRRYRVEFYGRGLAHVGYLADKHDVRDQVSLHAPVPYKASLAIQASADILLLLLWDHPAERGVHTGKLFEYLGAGKPVLAIGPHDTAASELIEQEQIGEVASNPKAIAEILDRWTESPNRPRPARSLSHYTREQQFLKLETLMRNVVGAGS